MKMQIDLKEKAAAYQQRELKYQSSQEVKT